MSVPFTKVHRQPAEVPAGRRPVVSVVIPCYNYGHYLPECVRSVVDQPDVQTEVLIIDDASPDGSGSVARQLALQHRNVRAVVHEQNRGHIATYNEGLPQMTGDYLVLLSADDLLAPGALGRATALLEAHPTVGMAYGNPQTFFDVPPEAATEVRSWSVWQGHDWVRRQFRRGMSIVYSPEAVVRTSVHHQVGWYKPELPHSGDLELWLRIAAVADIGRVNGPDQAYRREHPGSMMHTQYGTVLIDLRTRDEAYAEFLDTAGSSLPDATRLRELSHRRMADEALDWACLLLSGADRDGAADAEIADCVAFAREIYPGYAGLRSWQEYRLLTSGGGLLAAVGRPAHRVRRDLKGRLRWQRWHRMGL
ncbi:MAG TPA: glycosyltransferase [Jatrophihabitans sp.]|nr:glycosyltransferase [Jatrophihabitans sp.]